MKKKREKRKLYIRCRRAPYYIAVLKNQSHSTHRKKKIIILEEFSFVCCACVSLVLESHQQ